MNKKIRTLLIIISSVLIFVFAVGIILDNIGTTYTITTNIEKNENYNVRVVEDEKYTTLAKYDGDTILDDDFKVMCFSDLHLDHKGALGEFTLNMYIKNIMNEKPDLVVLLGDNFTSALNKPRVIEFAEVMELLGVYWTFVLGNHEHSSDNLFCITRARTIDILKKYDHCLVTDKYDKDQYGNGNHVINLLNSNGISQTLFFLDSGTEMSKADQEKYKDELEAFSTSRVDDYIKDDQVKWYSDTLTDILSENPNTKSTIFFHIPTIEYHEAYTLYSGETKVNPFNETISRVTLESGEDGLIYGLRREVICCSGHRSNIVSKAIELGSTQAIFTGHDHSNNFVLRYNGIILGCCETSGYSSNNVWTKGISEDLIEGYSLYTYSSDGSISIENKVNEEIWPRDLVKSVIPLIEEDRGRSYVDKSSDYR